MSNYTIRELEQLTGVKAHTIRIWEQRYGLFAPERTETNIRYYNNEELKKLLNISSLLAKGMKISKISQMPLNQLNAHLTDLYEANRIAKVQPSQQDKVNSLVLASIDFNEDLFSTVYDNAFQSLGFYDTILTVIYPFLNRVGLLWVTTEMHPGHEHFVSNLIRQKIIVGIDKMQFSSTSSLGQKFLLFLPEGETHELGLLLANYLIRAAGHKTIYLGQNLPTKDLLAVMHTIKPDALLLMTTSPQTRTKLPNLAKALGQLPKPQIPILVSGNPRNQDYLGNEVNVTWLNSPNALVEYLHQLGK